MLARLQKLSKNIWRKFRLINWISAALAILKASGKGDFKVDPKYIIIKPRILSDENLLRGVAVLRATLTLIPSASIAAPVLGLGEMGFKVWKRLSLARDYEQLEFPPVGPNMLRLSIQLDPELKKHYGELTLEQNWGPQAIKELEKVYNDFQFLTNFEMLRVKYPQVDQHYVKERANKNMHNLQQNLDSIEQGLITVSQSPEIEHNIRQAFDSVKKIFPAMNDWSLFNSEGFDDVVEILDIIL